MSTDRWGSPRVAGRPTEVRIGDSLVMVTSAVERERFPAFLTLAPIPFLHDRIQKQCWTRIGLRL
jgi:hypothetical protein